MSNFQLWSRDEYGQGAILMTSEDVDEVVKKAKEEVTNINVNNALTTDDRERNWEAYFVMVENKKSKTKYIYCGQDVHVKDRVYSIGKEKVESIILKDIKNPVVKVYLGNISTSRLKEVDWFAKDLKQNAIDKVDHPMLKAKTSFFIKMV